MTKPLRKLAPMPVEQLQPYRDARGRKLINYAHKFTAGEMHNGLAEGRGDLTKVYWLFQVATSGILPHDKQHNDIRLATKRLRREMEAVGGSLAYIMDTPLQSVDQSHNLHRENDVKDINRNIRSFRESGIRFNLGLGSPRTQDPEYVAEIDQIVLDDPNDHGLRDPLIILQDGNGFRGLAPSGLTIRRELFEFRSQIRPSTEEL